jgi:hypothetical protein
VSAEQPVIMVTSHHIEHPYASNPRIKTGLIFIGAAAAIVALAAGSPSANADTVDLPDFPIETSVVGSTANTIPLLFTEATQTEYATYTDLLGDHVAETAAGNNQPLTLTDIFVPNETNPTFVAAGEVDPNFDVATLSNADVSGSTFGVIGFGSNLFNLYEDTPYEAFGGGGLTQNIDDVFAFFPKGLSDSASDIAFGIQYLDLPNAANPVDEINFLGQAGEILFSIPVTGDLLSGL